MARLGGDLLRLFLGYEGNEQLSLQKVCQTKSKHELLVEKIQVKMHIYICIYCLLDYCLMAAWMNNLELDLE